MNHTVSAQRLSPPGAPRGQGMSNGTRCPGNLPFLAVRGPRLNRAIRSAVPPTRILRLIGIGTKVGPWVAALDWRESG